MLFIFIVLLVLIKLVLLMLGIPFLIPANNPVKLRLENTLVPLLLIELLVVLLGPLMLVQMLMGLLVVLRTLFMSRMNYPVQLLLIFIIRVMLGIIRLKLLML